MRGIDFNKNWKFTLDKNVEAPHILSTCDCEWRTVDTPHDWSIEFDFDREKGNGATAYLLGGIGWYRKHFVTTPEMDKKDVIINFDGIYNRSHVYCNGNLISFHAYGFTPKLYDVTKFLNPVGEDNVIAVKVDHSRFIDSRTYTGSGLYRKVAMEILPKTRIPVWGTFITTSDNLKEVAKANLEIKVENNSLKSSVANISTMILDKEGNVVASAETNEISLSAGEMQTVNQTFEVKNPILWKIHNCYKYKAVTKVEVKGENVQRVETDFGFREFYFDKDKGFFFNGEHTYIKGVCLHMDAAPVGTAVPNDVWINRLTTLKNGGCNAIRTAHNPVSEEFLDLCDEMGFLVQEEFYDEWDFPKSKKHNCTQDIATYDYYEEPYCEYFRKEAREELQTVILRDRNHPCIFQWSIGNEIEWTYRKNVDATGYFGAHTSGNYFWTLPPFSKEKIRENIKNLPEEEFEMGKTAKKLVRWTKELDTTRAVVANMLFPSCSYECGYADDLDVCGFSYRQVMYDYAYQNYPQPIMGTENVPQWQEWKQVLDKQYVAGVFLWSGIDYLGEAGHHGGSWPQKSTLSGMISCAGYPKGAYFMFKGLWTDEPSIHIETQTLEKSLYDLKDGKAVEKVEGSWKTRLWAWQDVNPYYNYADGEKVAVEVYSNCETVSLYQDGNLVGTQKLTDNDDRVYKWIVDYKAGEIKAVGEKNGVTVEEKMITAKTASKAVMTADKTSLTSDYDCVSHVTLQMLDENDNPVKHIEKSFTFEIEGCGKLVAVDNGDVFSVQKFQNDTLTTYLGRGLILVRGLEKGEFTLTAKCEGIAVNSVKFTVE